MSRQSTYKPELENLEIELLQLGVSRHYGVSLENYAPGPFRRRLWESIRRERVRTVSALLDKLLHDSACLERFLSALSSPETASPYSADFYRRLRSEIVPLLRTYPFVRIWQASCASLRDIYALAIVLMEEGIYEKTTIYATDMNGELVRKAQEGAFPRDQLSEYNTHYLKSGGTGSFSNYCVADGGEVLFEPFLKRQIVFFQHHLATDSSFNEFNAIFCPNVVSRFSAGVQARAHEVLYESLGLFGILGLGPRETIEASPKHFCYSELDPKLRLYRKTQ